MKLEVARGARGVLLLVLGWLLAGPGATARAGGIETDRPGFAAGTSTVPPWTIQLEGGATYTSAGVVGGYNLPELLIRGGVLSRVEVRIGVPDYIRIDDSGVTDHRLGQASLGLKFQGLDAGSRFGVALIPSLTVPVDPDDERNIAPELQMAWTVGLREGAAVSGGIGYAWLENAERGPDVFRATLTVSRPVNDDVATFVEWAGELPQSGGTGTQFFHHGYTWAMSPRVQLDVHGALGLTHDAPDFFLGAGVSIRP